MNNYKIIVSGGGTGGHIFPAISIANTLKRRFPEAEIRFVGADNRMEMERVPRSGYEIVGLPIKGLDRKHLLSNYKVAIAVIRFVALTERICGRISKWYANCSKVFGWLRRLFVSSVPTSRSASAVTPADRYFGRQLRQVYRPLSRNRTRMPASRISC